MALTFFWRCEGTTLNGTNDFSAGDTTATANSTPSISATAARIGTNGILIDSVSDQYTFDSASIWNRLVGSAAFSFQFPSALAGATKCMFRCQGASSSNNIGVALAASQEISLVVNQEGGGETFLTTTAANLSVGTWYGVVIRWDQPNNDRSISVYDSSNALIQTVSDTTTAYTAPADFSSSDNFRIGDNSGAMGTFYIDNVFVSQVYDEPLQDFLTITSYTEYGAGAPPITDGPKLVSVRSNLRLN